MKIKNELLKFIITFILAFILVCGFINRTIIIDWKPYNKIENPNVEYLVLLQVDTDSTFNLVKVISDSINVNSTSFSYTVNDSDSTKIIHLRMLAKNKNGITSKMSNPVTVDLNRPDRVQEVRARIKSIWN